MRNLGLSVLVLGLLTLPACLPESTGSEGDSVGANDSIGRRSAGERCSYDWQCSADDGLVCDDQRRACALKACTSPTDCEGLGVEFCGQNARCLPASAQLVEASAASCGIPPLPAPSLDAPHPPVAYEYYRYTGASQCVRRVSRFEEPYVCGTTYFYCLLPSDTLEAGVRVGDRCDCATRDQSVSGSVLHHD